METGAQTSDVFEKYYRNYLGQIADLDLASVAPLLGLESRGKRFTAPFFGQAVLIAKEGFVDDSGAAPSYGACVILARYILGCPARIHRDENWCAFRDFKKASPFTNVNYFASDTERSVVTAFAGGIDPLFKAGAKLGGVREDGVFSYDLVMRFTALPRIGLPLFNDGDEDFPAFGTALFQKQAEHYLDPESLAMASAVSVTYPLNRCRRKT